MVQSGKHVSMTLKEFLDEWNNESETLLVHTSGSTGSPKPLIVEKKRWRPAHIPHVIFWN